MSFFGEVAAFAKEHGADEAMKPYVAPLSTALGHLQQATTWLMQNAMVKPDNAGAAATDYMQLFGLVTFGYMWARMAKVAQDKIAGSGATPYLTTKLVTGRFFMERMLPETRAASRAHPDRKRDHHGIGGGSFLIGEILRRPPTIRDNFRSADIL